MKYLFYLIVALSSIFYIYEELSSETVWYDEVPQQYIGAYSIAPEEVKSSRDRSESIIISKDFIIQFLGNIDGKNIYRKGKVLKANYNGERSIVFFGEPNDIHISEYRLGLKLDVNGSLIIYDILEGYDGNSFEDYYAKFNKR